MQIERAATNQYPLDVTDLGVGHVYESSARDLFIVTDEGTIVDLESGAQWDIEESDYVVGLRYRPVNAKLVIES